MGGLPNLGEKWVRTRPKDGTMAFERFQRIWGRTRETRTISFFGHGKSSRREKESGRRRERFAGSTRELRNVGGDKRKDTYAFGFKPLKKPNIRREARVGPEGGV